MVSMWGSSGKSSTCELSFRFGQWQCHYIASCIILATTFGHRSPERVRLAWEHQVFFATLCEGPRRNVPLEVD